MTGRARGALLVALLAAAPMVVAIRASAAATITIVNGDGPGEGLNDPTPASPVGGNSGTTLGAQRLIAAQYAADTWAAVLDSAVEVRVRLNFDPLPCSAGSAVLGSTGPTSAHANFVNAPRIDTWYPQALANKFAGMDLSPLDDIAGAFNSAVGTTCALPRGWYYGLDASPSGTDIDFVTVVLHELAHGLGFTSFVDLQTGAKLFDHDDAFSLALEDHSACRLYPAMSDTQRIGASVDTGDLHWVGSNVVDASGSLTAGVHHPSGHVEMYAPNPALPGSSVSHFSTALMPNELMEPSYTGPDHDVTLTRDLLLDVGWSGSAPLLLGPLCTGGEFQVNTTVVGDQHDPAVAFDGSGNFVIVWQSEGIQNIFLPDQLAPTGVFGQRFDSNGNRIGGEFAITTNLSESVAEYPMIPDVTTTPDGGFIVVWTNNGDAWARRYASDSTPLGAEFMVNTYTTGFQGWPTRVRADQNGNFVIVWFSQSQDDGDADGGGVFGQRFDAAGNRLGVEFQVNTFTPHAQGKDGIGLAVGPAGDFVVVWNSIQQYSPVCCYGLDSDVYGQRFASDGTPVGGEFLVNTHTDGDEGRDGLDVAMNAAGDSVVVWQGPNDGDVFHNSFPLGGIIGQRFSSAGAPVGSELVLNTRTRGFQDKPRVAIADDGGFVVVWETIPGFPNDSVANFVQHEIDVEAQRFDGTGAKVGPEFRVNSYVPQTQRYGAIAMRPDGDFVAAWTSITCEGTTENLCFASQDGEGKGVFAQRFNLEQPTCGPTPRTTCLGAGQSLLSFSGEKLKWIWRGGPPLNLGHFGQPAAGITSYAFCAYQDGAPSNPVVAATVPAGTLCAGRPCWHTVGKNGYRYRDTAGASGGMTKIRLQAGDEGKSRVIVQGGGPNLNVPAPPLSSYTGVTAQLVNGNGECWEATYAPPATRNNSGGFKAKF